MSRATTRETTCRLIAQKLRAERERKGLSMERLAEKSGLSTSMISLVERDLRNPTIETLLRISESLELDLSVIIGEAVKEARKSS